MKSFVQLFIALLFTTVSAANAAVLAAWDTSGYAYNPPDSTSMLSHTFQDPGVAVTEIELHGITQLFATNAVIASGWSTDGALDTSNATYFSFTLSAQPGKEVTYTSIDYNFSRHVSSGSGTRLVIGYRIDEGSGFGGWTLGPLYAPIANSSIQNLDFTDFTTAGTVEFAFFGYGVNSAASQVYMIRTNPAGGPAMVVYGDVETSAVPEPTRTVLLAGAAVLVLVRRRRCNRGSRGSQACH